MDVVLDTLGVVACVARAGLPLNGGSRDPPRRASLADVLAQPAVRAGTGPDLPHRAPGPGPAAGRPAQTRPAAQPQHRRLRVRLRRITVRRLRPGTGAAAGAPGR